MHDAQTLAVETSQRRLESSFDLTCDGFQPGISYQPQNWLRVHGLDNTSPLGLINDHIAGQKQPEIEFGG